MENEHNNEIKKNIFQAIKDGTVSMRPKWYFVLQTVLFILGIIMVSLAIVYVISFVISVLWESGIWFVPMFGSRGWSELFVSLPWTLVITAILFILVLEILVRHFSFAARRPIVYTLLGIVLLMGIGGAFAAPFHREFFRAAYEDKLPVMGGFYRGYGAPPPRNTFVGVISETFKNGFFIEDRNNVKVKVTISPKTRFPFGTELSEGDAVVVLGDFSSGTVQALGIREINSEFGSSTMRASHMPKMRRNMMLEWNQ